MKDRLRRLAALARRLWESPITGAVLLVVILAGVALWLLGCAAGKGPAGEIVVGFDVGRVVESAPEAANALAGLLPPPFNMIATGGIALLAGWGAEKRARIRENQSWDQAKAEADTEAAKRLAALLTPAPSATVPAVTEVQS